MPGLKSGRLLKLGKCLLLLSRPLGVAPPPVVTTPLGGRLPNLSEKSGDRSAISAYSKVWGKYAGHFKFSCPAMNRTIEIEMQHGTKQSAYKLSQSWLRSMAKHTEHPVAGEYLRKATAMRDDLANDPSVTVDKD